MPYTIMCDFHHCKYDGLTDWIFKAGTNLDFMGWFFFSDGEYQSEDVHGHYGSVANVLTYHEDIEDELMSEFSVTEVAGLLELATAMSFSEIIKLNVENSASDIHLGELQIENKENYVMPGQNISKKPKT